MGDDIVDDEDSHTNVHSVFDPRGTFIFSPTPNFSPTPLSLSLLTLLYFAYRMFNEVKRERCGSATKVTHTHTQARSLLVNTRWVDFGQTGMPDGREATAGVPCCQQTQSKSKTKKTELSLLAFRSVALEELPSVGMWVNLPVGDVLGPVVRSLGAAARVHVVQPVLALRYVAVLRLDAPSGQVS